MNIFKKLFGKTSIEEAIVNNNIKPELILLSRFKNDNMYDNISCLLVFDKSYLVDFAEVISTNKLRLSMKIKDKVYVYFVADEKFKIVMDNISSTNPFFSVLKEVLCYYPISYCKEYYENRIIEKFNRDYEMINEVDDILNVISIDINKIGKDIFTFRDLCNVITLNDVVSLYDIIRDELSLFKDDYLRLINIYGDSLISSIKNPKYNENYKDIDIENLITEELNEIEVIKEDENGNLIYDKDQFI